MHGKTEWAQGARASASMEGGAGVPLQLNPQAAEWRGQRQVHHAEKRVGGEEVEAAGVDTCFAKSSCRGEKRGRDVEGGLSLCVEVGSRVCLYAEGTQLVEKEGRGCGSRAQRV